MAVSVAAPTPEARSPTAPNAFPTPKPVSPDIIPSLRSPVTAVVARPEPTALASAEFAPRAASPPPKVVPVPSAVPIAAKADPPNMLPNKGAKNGKNASGCPVIGLVVREPVGDKDANP